MAQTISSREPVTGTASTPKKRKPFLLDLYGTAVGKKYVMAITGIIGIGYVVAHMVGNLKMYLGADGTVSTRSTTTASSCASCSCRCSRAP